MDTRKANVAVVGISIVDFLGLIEQIPIRGGAAPGSSLEIFPGGAGGTVSTGLSRLGVSASFVGQIGNDYFGQFLLNDFKREGVDTSRLVVSDSHRTGVVFLVTDEDGERTGFEFRNGSADTAVSPQVLDREFISNQDLVYIDGIMLAAKPTESARTALAAAVLADDSDVPLVFDPNLRVASNEISEHMRSVAEAIVALSDIVLVSEFEAQLLTGTAEPKEVAKRLMDIGASYVILKEGPDGCSVLDGKSCVKVPAFKVDAVDTTGAGDAFSVGFMWGILNGHNLKDAAIIGNYVGSLVVQTKGARTSLPRSIPAVEELVKLMESQGRSCRSC